MAGGVRLNFTFDAVVFTDRLAEYARLTTSSKSKTTIIQEQMKFAIRAIIDLTPFNTLAEGRQVVHRDLLRAVKPYGGENGDFAKVRGDSLRARLVGYLRAGSYDKIKDVFEHLNQKGGYYSGFSMVDFNPTLHHSVQNSRGRVVADERVLTPQVSQWKDYLGTLYASVGRARGGWTSSAQAVGLDLPQWNTRHAAGGAVNATIEPNKVTFTFINRAIFIPDYRAKIELALAGREKAMANDLRRMFAGQATHAGFGR